MTTRSTDEHLAMYGIEVPAFPSPDYTRADTIRGFIAAGVLRVEHAPGTYRRLADDARHVVRNAMLYRDREVVTEQLQAYKAWRRAERKANARVDELLIASTCTRCGAIHNRPIRDFLHPLSIESCLFCDVRAPQPAAALIASGTPPASDDKAAADLDARNGAP